MQSPEEAVRAYEDAFNNGDLDTLIASYEPGATLVPQPGQVASGTAAIREAIGGDSWRWVVDVPFGIS